MTAWVSAHPGVATALALLLLLPVFHRGLARLAWPMQQRLADDMAWLHGRRELSVETRDLVGFMGRHAFDGFAMMAFCLALPFAIAFDTVKRDPNHSDPLCGYPTEVQRVLDRTVHRFMLSIAAINPLFAVVFAFELLLAMTVTGLLGLLRVTTVKPLQGAESSLREALTLYDRNLTRFT